MASTNELKARLSMDDSNFQGALRRAASAAASAGSKIAGALKNVGTSPFKAIGGVISSLVTGPLAALSAGIAGALAGRAIYQGISNVYDAGAALYRLHERTGASVGGLAQIQAAFTMAGVDADVMGVAINKLEKQIDEGGSAFGDLGLKIAELQGMAPDKQFVTVGKVIAAIASPTEKAGAAMSIFGRAGGQLLAVFESPAFQTAGGELSGKAKVMAENAETFYHASLALTKAGKILKGFYIGIAGGIGDAILPALNKLASLDLVGIGMRFGKAIGGALRGLGALVASNDPFKYAILSLKLGLADAVAFFASKIADALDALAGALGKGGGNPLFGSMMTGLADALKTAAGAVRGFATSMEGAAAAARAARDNIGSTGDDATGLDVSGRSSIFKSAGMRFNSPGVSFGPGMQFQNVFSETAGGALGAAIGPTVAHDAGWGAGGLSSGGLLSGQAYDIDAATRRAAAQKAKEAKAEAKGTVVQAPSLEEILKQIRDGTDELKD